MRRLRLRTLVSLAVLLASAGALGALLYRLHAGTERARRSFLETKVRRIDRLGTTRCVSVLPLVDWHVANDDLIGEPGVSYLVRTDDQSILFDVGFNRDRTDPSPIAHNMQALGVKLEDVDTVVISHNHLDHVGGLDWSRRSTFSLANEQLPLTGKRIWAPVPMTYPGVAVRVSQQPTVIGSSVATIGVIPRQLFIGWIDEQAIAVNVEGRGIVLVVGCGHQTLERIVQRTRALFAQPIYGIVGGLHYPLPSGRVRMFGVDVQRRLASGDGPFATLDVADLDRDLQLLQSLGLGLLAVGGHDSSDAVLKRIAAQFGPANRPVRVGDPISVCAP